MLLLPSKQCVMYTPPLTIIQFQFDLTLCAEGDCQLKQRFIRSRYLLLPCYSGEENALVYETILQHVASVPGSFGGKGKPKMLMRDDAAAISKAVNSVFGPDTQQLNCLFHSLQACWRWVMSNVQNTVSDVKIIKLCYKYSVAHG